MAINKSETAELEASIYHFYLWKEKQALVVEEKLARSRKTRNVKKKLQQQQQQQKNNHNNKGQVKSEKGNTDEEEVRTNTITTKEEEDATTVDDVSQAVVIIPACVTQVVDESDTPVVTTVVVTTEDGCPSTDHNIVTGNGGKDTDGDKKGTTTKAVVTTIDTKEIVEDPVDSDDVVTTALEDTKDTTTTSTQEVTAADDEEGNPMSLDMPSKNDTQDAAMATKAKDITDGTTTTTETLNDPVSNDKTSSTDIADTTTKTTKSSSSSKLKKKKKSRKSSSTLLSSKYREIINVMEREFPYLRKLFHNNKHQQTSITVTVPEVYKRYTTYDNHNNSNSNKISSSKRSNQEVDDDIFMDETITSSTGFSDERQRRLSGRKRGGGSSGVHNQQNAAVVGDSGGNGSPDHSKKRMKVTKNNNNNASFLLSDIEIQYKSETYDEELMVDDVYKSFSDYFKLLEDFYHLHGHFRVPEEDDPMLALWISKIRTYYKDAIIYPSLLLHERKPTVSQLTHDRIDLLNQLGFLWSRKNQNRPKILKWDERLNQLVLFKEEFGHTMVPRRYEDDLPLGEWVHLQRKEYRKNILSTERILKLNDIGFNWNVSRARRIGSTENLRIVSWSDRMEQCRGYVELNGDLNIPLVITKKEDGTDPSKDELSFRIWAHNQKNEYRIMKDAGNESTPNLTAEMIQQLDELGFVWDLPTTSSSSDPPKLEQPGGFVNADTDSEAESVTDSTKLATTNTDATTHGGGGGGVPKKKVPYEKVNQHKKMPVVDNIFIMRFKQIKVCRELYGNLAFVNLKKAFPDQAEQIFQWVKGRRKRYWKDSEEITDESRRKLDPIDFEVYLERKIMEAQDMKKKEQQQKKKGKKSSSTKGIIPKTESTTEYDEEIEEHEEDEVANRSLEEADGGRNEDVDVGVGRKNNNRRNKTKEGGVDMQQNESTTTTDRTHVNEKVGDDGVKTRISSRLILPTKYDTEGI